MANDLLGEWEYQILREVAGEIPGSPWGAAVGVALEHLFGFGYTKAVFASRNDITEKGRKYLNDRRANVPT